MQWSELCILTLNVCSNTKQNFHCDFTELDLKVSPPSPPAARKLDKAHASIAGVRTFDRVQSLFFSDLMDWSIKTTRDSHSNFKPCFVPWQCSLCVVALILFAGCCGPECCLLALWCNKCRLLYALCSCFVCFLCTLLCPLASVSVSCWVMSFCFESCQFVTVN